MRQAIIIMLGLVAGSVAHAQSYGGVNGYCNLGGAHAKVQGLNATNYQQGIIPGCTVTVYLAGTTNTATIYKDAILTPQTNPFTANVASSPNSGAWTFFAAGSQGYDVCMSGGTAPNVYSQPVCIYGVFPNTSIVGAGPVLQVNGVNNQSQTLLNIEDGNYISCTNPSGGNVQCGANPQALGAPAYNAASCNVTVTSTTTTVTLNVTKGDLLLALAMENDYAVSAPGTPSLSDTQGNGWTTDASGQYTYIGGTGTGNIAAHTFASASGSITVTTTSSVTGGNAELVVVDVRATGVDVAGIAGVTIGSLSSVAPTATATASGDLAVTLALSNSSFGAGTAIPPGAVNYTGSACGQDAMVGTFPALYPGIASTSGFGGSAGNVNTAAIFLITSALSYGSGTMLNPMYQLGDMVYGGTSGQATRLPNPSAVPGTYMPTEVVTSPDVPVAPSFTQAPRVYTTSWTPAAATASSCVEQTHTVTGLVTNDVVSIRPPNTLGTHLWIGLPYVSALNTLSVPFCADATGGTPPSGTWSILAMHP